MKRLKFISFFCLLSAVSMTFYTCKDEITTQEIAAVVFPDSNVSYFNQVQPLFDRACGGQVSECHGSETFGVRQFRFSLDSYTHATNDISVIRRRDPDHSLLINTIEETVPPQMPPSDRPQLNSNQKKGLRTWVKEGAFNN